MKSLYSLLTIGMTLFFVSCKTEHNTLIQVDAQSGKVKYANLSMNDSGKSDTTFLRRKQQYLSKSDNLTIEVIGIKPNQTTTISANQSYQEITSEPQLSNPFADLPTIATETPTNGAEKAAEELIEERENTLNELNQNEHKIIEIQNELDKVEKNKSTNKTTKSLETARLNAELRRVNKEIVFKELELEIKDRKADSIEVVMYLNNGNRVYSNYYNYFVSATSKSNLDEKCNMLEAEITNHFNVLDNSKVNEFHNLKVMYEALQSNLYDLLNRMKNHKFSQTLEVLPYKERVDISVDISTTKTTVSAGATQTATTTSTIYSGEFITKNSFKMLVSVGFHTLVSDGANVRNYSNFDSTIVDRKGSNIIPSFGTYLNATWRVRDALVGFGVGTGIPFSSDAGNELTPNFSLFGTSIFQTDAGRMGFNIGVGLRKINYLAPGYSVGDAISPDVTVIPTFGRWRPTFMVGVSYTIPEKGTN